MASEDIALMAHLMRRAGFGASREELEARAAKGYEATVEELVNPEAEPVDRYDFLPVPPRVLEAHHLSWHGGLRVVSYHAEHETAAGGEDGALLAPGVRHRSVEDRQLARAHQPSRHVPRARAWATTATCWSHWRRTRP